MLNVVFYAIFEKLLHENVRAFFRVPFLTLVNSATTTTDRDGGAQSSDSFTSHTSTANSNFLIDHKLEMNRTQPFMSVVLDVVCPCFTFDIDDDST